MECIIYDDSKIEMKVYICKIFSINYLMNMIQIGKKFVIVVGFCLLIIEQKMGQVLNISVKIFV